MSGTFTVLDAAIAFFVDAANGVEYSTPRDLGAGGIAAPLCIIDAAGEVGPQVGPEQMQRYTLRFYGIDDLAALDAYELTRLACYEQGPVQGVLRCNVDVRGKQLKWMQVGGLTGPVQEPGTERWIYTATATGKWST